MSGAEGALNRSDFLAKVGESRLAEETVDLEGLGKVVCRELSGSARARVLAMLAPAASGGTVDFEAYQERLLTLGLVDPSDGQPLLDVKTAKDAMRLGGSLVEQLCSKIEQLSGLDKSARERAEGNSATTQS